MKHLFLAVVLLAGVGGATTLFADKKEGASAVHIESQTDKGPLKRRELDIITLTATIKSLDVESRVATITRPDGKEVTLKVSPQVKRLDEMKPGDKVVTKYMESLAFEVREPTEAEMKNPSDVVAAAGKNSKELPPGIAAGVVASSIVEIESIDMETNIVGIKFPSGKSYTMKAKIPENLKRVKVGDTVAVTYAEAVAVAIDPVKAAS